MEFHVSNTELSWKLVHFCWLVDLRQDFTIWPRLSLNLRSQTCVTMPGLNCCSDMFQSEVSLSEINEIGLSSWMQILKEKNVGASVIAKYKNASLRFHLLD